jgi:trk system potassium uptake protein TrkA
MHVVIVGCGRVGAMAAGILSRDGLSVVVIDRIEKAFKRLPKGYTGKKILGVGFDREILEQAGIDHADAFVAVTNGDNSNIVSARIAKDVYRVPIIITRIYDPLRAEIYRRLGVLTFSTTVWGADKIVDLLTSSQLGRESDFGNGEVQMVQVWAPSHIIGKSVSEVDIPGEIKVSVIVRMGKPFIPVSGTSFEENDQLHVIVHQTAINRFKRMMGLEST